MSYNEYSIEIEIGLKLTHRLVHYTQFSIFLVYLSKIKQINFYIHIPS